MKWIFIIIAFIFLSLSILLGYTITDYILKRNKWHPEYFVLEINEVKYNIPIKAGGTYKMYFLDPVKFLEIKIPVKEIEKGEN